MGWGHLGTPGRVSPSRSQALKASGPVLTEGFSLKFKQRLFILHFPPENESQWTKWYLLLSAALIFFWYFSTNTCLKTNATHMKEPGAARGEGHAAWGTLPPACSGPPAAPRASGAATPVLSGTRGPQNDVEPGITAVKERKTPKSSSSAVRLPGPARPSGTGPPSGPGRSRTCAARAPCPGSWAPAVAMLPWTIKGALIPMTWLSRYQSPFVTCSRKLS